MVLLDGDRLVDSIHRALCGHITCASCPFRTEDGGCGVERWLDDAPVVEPKMGDLIKRSDAIKAIEDLPNAYNGWSDAYDKAYIIGTLEEVPTAEPKQGKWIRKKSWSRGVGMGEVYGWYFECSSCGCLSEGSVNDAGNFCPNCGCRMEGVDDED